MDVYAAWRPDYELSVWFKEWPVSTHATAACVLAVANHHPWIWARKYRFVVGTRATDHFGVWMWAKYEDDIPF